MTLADPVTLRPITYDNFDDVIELKLHPEQTQNLPSNVYSIAESTLSPLFHPRAIVAGEVVVGFLMYEFGAEGAFDEGECTIWRFMIDRDRQNSGLGTQAMQLAIEEIKAHGLCSLIDIYYAPGNLVAKRLYTAFGFKETGFRDDGDVIAELVLETS